jgi:hypothetical protein
LILYLSWYKYNKFLHKFFKKFKADLSVCIIQYITKITAVKTFYFKRKKICLVL